MRQLRTTRTLFIALALVGCAAISDVQQSTQDFYDAASKLSDAEQRVLADVNASIVRSYQDRAAADYLSGRNFDLTTAPPAIPVETVDVRVKAVQAVQLYAQKLVDLTSAQENKNVDAYSQTTAQSLAKLVPSGGVSPTQVGAVTAAFTGIANIVLDHEHYKDIVSAAKAAQTPLETLSGLVKSDDPFIKNPLVAAAKVDGVAREQVLEAIRGDPKVPKDRWLAAFREITSTNAVADLSSEQAMVENLIDALVRANAALAKGDHTTFKSVAKEAAVRGSDTYNVFKATKKTQ
jgi:hypothetical protein